MSHILSRALHSTTQGVVVGGVSFVESFGVAIQILKDRHWDRRVNNANYLSPL